MKCTTTSLCAAAFAALLSMTTPDASVAQLLFSEDFDGGGAAARFTTSTINTPTIDYAYDYSAVGIPSAPNSGGSTIGLRMASRGTDTDEAGAVAAITNAFSVPAQYLLQFDMWINYNGGSGGGAGSTEMAFWGLNNTGSGILTGQFTGGDADGYAFTATGEGGAGGDYRVYYTDPTDDGSQYPKANATWAGVVDGDGDEPDNNLNAYFDDPTTGIFGGPEFETPGSPGKQWVAVKVKQNGSTVSTYFNDALVSTLTLAEAADGIGNLYFSYADIFTGSVPGDLPEAYVLIDNITVGVPEPASLALAALSCLGLPRRRRTR